MQAINLAIAAGRRLQKKQTGLIHYCHQSEDLITHDTIPLLENALFALALFRSRLSDNVLEGKALLERILAFEIEGNFPIYMHEYPSQNDPYLSYRLLPIFYWITIDFSHVIGDLRGKLEMYISRSLQKKEDLPAWVEFRLEAFEGKVGTEPQTFHEWCEALVSLQIAQKKGANIDAFLQKALCLWHPNLSFYIGPKGQRHQWGYEPEITLFDLFMCSWQHHFSNRILNPHPIHLRGALIRPQAAEFEEKPLPWIHFSPEEECPLYIAWENHIFVLAKKQLIVEGDAKELILTPPGDEDMGVNFYLNYHPDHAIWVDGKKATAFRAGQQLQIVSKGLNITLSFTSDDGEYFGHIMRGNRPSQHLCHGENAFTAYDWKIAIRTVSLGKSPIRVRAVWQKLESQPPLPLHASHCPHTESPL